MIRELLVLASSVSFILNFGCQRVLEHSDWSEMIILANRTPREGLYIAREEIIAVEYI